MCSGGRNGQRSDCHVHIGASAILSRSTKTDIAKDTKRLLWKNKRHTNDIGQKSNTDRLGVVILALRPS